MERDEPSTRIVKFTGGELTLDEASSGPYVFATGREPDTIYAFEERVAEKQVEEWAAQQGVTDRLSRAREVIAKLPEDPSSQVDVDAERAEGERVNALLDQLSAELGIPVGSPDFLRIAHERGIFDSAILYRDAGFREPKWPLSTSAPNVPLITGWSQGARSCEAIGFQAVYLYEGTNYGPNRFSPAVRLTGGLFKIDVSPRFIRSVLFI
jgi:hypothetical protein